MRLSTHHVVIACFCAAALAAAGCADGSGNPVSPGASPAASSLAATASPRSGALHVLKECSAYTGQAGDFCTITSSNVAEIEVGSKVFYAQAADFTIPSLDSDVVLDPPGPGNNTASGHCHLNLATGLGRCTFSGGTGKFTFFNASIDTGLPVDGVHWRWDGTYSFNPPE
jgi:hypothetical protein